MASHTTHQSTNLTLEVTMSTITSPLPYIPADALRRAHSWLSGGMPGAVAMTFDARAFGADVDEVTVRLQDLEFIHSVDAARFGKYDECPFCND